jgi:hypothetical protein
MNTRHARFLKRMGVTRKSGYRGSWEDSFLEIPTRATSPTSDTMGSGFKRSIDDYKWRRGFSEKSSTVAEIEAKKGRIAPAFNKGAYQYVTDSAEPQSLGRKI